jgi:hypothetical protein
MSTENSKPSRLALISLILGIVIWFLWCGLYGVLGILAESGNLSETAGYTGFIGGPLVLGVLTLLLGIPGVILGIQAIRKKDPKRGLAIAGLALNFICLCPFLLVLVLMLAQGVSSIPELINQYIR